jgi:putative tryptophan/tyrosine transport system substrate-binding protein
VDRRKLITLLGGAAAMWPLVARAQQPAMPVIGFLRSTPAAPFAHLVVELRNGLSEEGFIEGRNLAIEQRFGDNQPERLPGLAADLVRRKVAVIVANTPALEAARAAEPSIPIVFVVGDDPVKMGLVASLNRPEGNLTGVTFFGGSLLGAKRLELLHQLVPKIAVVAVLIDPHNPAFEAGLPSIETAARALGLKLVLVKAASERDLDGAYARIVAAGADAVLFGDGPVVRSQLQQVVALAARHAIPTIYELRDYVQAGGLISYAASFAGAYRQAGIYAGRILKGAKPSELPVLQPTTYELAINLKTAKALGLDVPPSLLVRADEVIE